ncbi:poly(U)-specific endoribonuclease homolog, partial [Ceratina calcarata]|uniref:Poly(U)-specific endoribonuclease homolog n=1 Tax=Ceratina calcarata TaxID=156304 RepID=A0AAJ7IWF6_9HYME
MLNNSTVMSLHTLVIVHVVIVFSLTTHQIGVANNIFNVPFINDNELKTISERLFSMSHGLLNYVHINYQGQASFKNFSDMAPERLLNISSNITVRLTTKSLIKLFNNYELDVYRPEIITKEKDIEENEFIDNLLKTDVMLDAMYSLSVKGFFQSDTRVYKNILKELWFHLYSRSKGINGSSGFEHVFIGERKPRKGVVGLHNWIYFSYGESINNINYYGFSCNKEFDEKAVILETYFTYIRKRKMSTIFVGTTPELEIALYTLCFFARPNKKCKLSFTGSEFHVQTYVSQSNGKKFVGT